MKAILILLLLGFVYSQCTGTECPLDSGKKGCCPYAGATCCSDKKHCCPNNFDCDLTGDRCVKHGNEFLAYVGLMEQVKPIKVNSTEDIVKCVKDFIPLLKDGIRVYLDVKGAKVFDIGSAIKALITDEKVAVSDCAALFKNTSSDELRSNLEESGLYQYQGVKDILKCVNDLIPVIKDGEKVVEDVESKDIQDLLTTIPRLVGEAKLAYDDCSKVTEVESFEQKKLTDMVQCVKDLIPLVADGEKIYNDVKSKKSPAEVIQDLTKIIADGEKAYADCTATYVSEVQGVQDILKCVSDLVPIVKDGEEIYQAVKAKDITEIIKDLTKLIQDGKTAYADCTKAFPKKIELTGTIDVLKCVKDLIPVVADAKAVYTDIEGKDVTNIVKDLGKLINDGKLAYSDCVKAFPQKEVTGTADVLKCIKELIPVVADAKAVYTDIEGKDIQHMIVDVKKLVDDGKLAYADCIKAFPQKEVTGPADIFQCIKDLAPLVKDGEKFAEDVQSKKYTEIVADLVQAVKDGKVAYKDCLKAFGQ